MYLALGPGTKVGYLGNLGKVGDVRVFLVFLVSRSFVPGHFGPIMGPKTPPGRSGIND